MITILQAIQEEIKKVPGMNYVDEDWGQLDYYSPNFPVQWPCALIDTASEQYSNVGRSIKETPVNRQMGDVLISITIANLKITNTSGMAPQLQKDNAWSIHALKEEVHKVIQGFKPAENAGALIRVSGNRVKRDDGVQEYTVRYSMGVTNV